VHHGRIAFADWLRGFGLLLIVDHGDGYMTLYGHNQSLFKEAGDWVEAGEPVAAVGRSGGRDLAGVYFGIRHQGKAINPARWCRRPRGRKVG
jgi:septal ring factor EnvC (AmiA/AmiB activator)